MASGYKEVMVALRGGLNTALDPSIIRDDELAEAAGLEYRPPRGGLFNTPGRSQFGTFSATAGSTRVSGLVYTQFDQAYPVTSTATAVPATEGYIVAYSGSSAFYASSSSSPTWTKFSSGFSVASSTAFFDGLHYGNELFMWNGGEQGRVWRLDHDSQIPASYLELHGLISVTASAYAFATAVAGATLPVGTYEIWSTETRRNGVEYRDMLGITRINEIESSFSGNPAVVEITATGVGIELVVPSAINANVYSRPVYVGYAGQRYPFGFVQGRLFASGTGYGYIAALATSEGADGPAGPLFPYQIAGPVGGIPVSANGRPPLIWDAVVYEDSIVCIDAIDRQVIKYSLPDQPHAFPAINFIPFDTPFMDRLNAIEAANDIILVFGDYYGFRIDYLPRHTDSEDIDAARGRAKTKFIEGHGCLSPRGTAVVPMPNGAEMVLFVCRDAIHGTDGQSVEDLTTNLDWAATVQVSSLSRSVLINNPKKWRIEFYYLNTDSNPRRLDFYYHPDLLKPGKVMPHLTIMGPTPVPGLAPALGLLNSDWYMWNGSEATPATVYIEGTGTSDAAGLENADGRITHTWKTKNFYMAGVGADYELFKVYTHQSQTTASGTYTITAEGRTDDEATSFIATSTVDQSLNGAQPHPAFHQRAQRFSVRGSKADGGAWQELNYIVFVVKSSQELHSGKSS